MASWVPTTFQRPVVHKLSSQRITLLTKGKEDENAIVLVSGLLLWPKSQNAFKTSIMFKNNQEKLLTRAGKITRDS